MLQNYQISFAKHRRKTIFNNKQNNEQGAYNNNNKTYISIVLIHDLDTLLKNQLQICFDVTIHAFTSLADLKLYQFFNFQSE